MCSNTRRIELETSETRARIWEFAPNEGRYAGELGAWHRKREPTLRPACEFDLPKDHKVSSFDYEAFHKPCSAPSCPWRITDDMLTSRLLDFRPPPVTVSFSIALWMNGTQIFERMTLNIGFGERKREIFGKPSHRLNVINMCSAVECAPLTLTERANTILWLFDQHAAMLPYREGAQHMKTKPLW